MPVERPIGTCYLLLRRVGEDILRIPRLCYISIIEIFDAYKGIAKTYEVRWIGQEPHCWLAKAACRLTRGEFQGLGAHAVEW